MGTRVGGGDASPLGGSGVSAATDRVLAEATAASAYDAAPARADADGDRVTECAACELAAEAEDVEEEEEEAEAGSERAANGGGTAPRRLSAASEAAPLLRRLRLAIVEAIDVEAMRSERRPRPNDVGGRLLAPPSSAFALVESAADKKADMPV